MGQTRRPVGKGGGGRCGHGILRHSLWLASESSDPLLLPGYNPSESLVLPGNLSVFPWSSRSPILSNFSAPQNQLGELKTI